MYAVTARMNRDNWCSDSKGSMLVTLYQTLNTDPRIFGSSGAKVVIAHAYFLEKPTILIASGSVSDSDHEFRKQIMSPLQ